MEAAEVGSDAFYVRLRLLLVVGSSVTIRSERMVRFFLFNYLPCKRFSFLNSVGVNGVTKHSHTHKKKCFGLVLVYFE